jgi:hypothetical protein
MTAPPSPFADPSRAAASGAVVVDAPLGVVSFAGVDAGAFLQGQLSSDVMALAPGMGQRATYNSPKGRMLATLYLGRVSGAPERYVALVAADLAAGVAKRLAMFVLRSKVLVVDETPALARFGVAGPGAAQAVASALGACPPLGGIAAVGEETTVAHLPEGRLVVLAPAAAADVLRERLAAHATPAPDEAWARVGIRAGVPTVTAATQDLFVAQTANQDALGALDFRKGCYTGQEIVARTHYLGRLKERLYILKSEAPPSAPATRLYSPAFGEQACGTIVESAPQPGGGGIALAVLQTAAAGGPVAIGAPDGPAAVPEPPPYPLPEPAPPPGRVRL